VLRLRNKLLRWSAQEHAQAREAQDETKSAFIVVMQVGNKRWRCGRRGVPYEEIVVKPMCSRLRNIALFAQHYLGDGAVIMIIDPNGLAMRSQLGSAAAAARTRAR